MGLSPPNDDVKIPLFFARLFLGAQKKTLKRLEFNR